MKALMMYAAVLLLGASVQSKQMGQAQSKEGNHSMMSEMTPMVKKAVCVLMPKDGDNVHGTITFEEVKGGVRVIADVTGLTPGKHGFHIHEFGDCSSLDFKSAGGHLHAEGEAHAGPTDPNRHIGDMGNLVAEANGKAHLELLDNKLSMAGPFSIIGRAVVVHEGADDLTSQPTGNAGGRAACGVIGIARE